MFEHQLLNPTSFRSHNRPKTFPEIIHTYLSLIRDKIIIIMIDKSQIRIMIKVQLGIPIPYFNPSNTRVRVSVSV